MKANGDEIGAKGALGIGPLAIGDIKYKTESGLFKAMIAAEKAVAFDFRDAFDARAQDRRREWLRFWWWGFPRARLSQSARSAGYAPLAADLFCDLDTQEAAERSVRIDGDLARGLEWPPLAAALTRSRPDREPIGIVCGSGFEDRPDLLDRMAERWPLLGNCGEAVARVKDPGSAGGALRELRHSASALERRAAGRGLAHASRSAAPGGSHVAAETGGDRDAIGRSASRASRFRRWSSPTERSALVLGLSAQWADPDAGCALPLWRRGAPGDLSPEIARLRCRTLREALSRRPGWSA